MANNSKTRNKYNIDDEIIIGYNTKMDKPKENKNNSKTKIKSSKNNNKKKKAKNSQNAKKSQEKKTGFLQVLKTIFKIIIAILASICIIIFLFVSPVFSIQEIDVNGEEKLNESVYISLSNIQMGQNIFEIDKTSMLVKFAVILLLFNASIIFIRSLNFGISTSSILPPISIFSISVAYPLIIG